MVVSPAWAICRVYRQLHNALALDERLHKECKEVQGEQRLDASLVLQEHGRDLVHGIDLLEALLDRGLALVGIEDLGGREAAVVGECRVHAVAFLVIGDGGLIEGPLEVVAAPGDFAVDRVGPGPATLVLLLAVLFAHAAAYREITPSVVVFQDLGYAQIDLGGRPSACLGAAKALA